MHTSYNRHLVLGVVIAWTTSLSASAPQSRIHFDLPSTAVASPTVAPVDQDSLATIPHGWIAVTVEFRLSCISESISETPAMQQCIVRCRPRDPSAQIVDYFPRTEIASDVASPIQVKSTQETTKSFGISLDGAYSDLAKAKAGTDQGSKTSECVQYDRIAPQQAVIAAGTTDRGRGVYFKLRWTDAHVIEGERRFRVTMAVPPNWRSDFIDVTVVGEATQRSITGWDSEVKPVAAAHFAVATYLYNDREAEELAHRIAEAEYKLRCQSALINQAPPSPKTLPEMLRHVAMKMDIDAPPEDTSWLARLILEQADPHVDKTIRRLPLDVRVTTLDYVDLRKEFYSLSKADSADSLARVPEVH